MSNDKGASNEQIVLKIKSKEDVIENMLFLWQQNQGFVHKMAVRYSGFAEVEDLKQEAYIGLCAAVEHYDEDKGVPFVNYAGFWIKQIMQRYIDNCGSVVRIPVGAREEIQKYRRVSNEYRKYYGREVTEREMSAFLGVSREKLAQIKENVRKVQIKSISEPIGGEEELFIADTIAADINIEEDISMQLDTAAMSKELWRAVDQLPEEQSEVIRQRYKEQKTLQEAGDSIGISVSAVRSIESKAMRTLRLQRGCGKFKRYFEEYLSAAPIRHIGVERFKVTWTSEVEREVIGGEEKSFKRIMYDRMSSNMSEDIRIKKENGKRKDKYLVTV